MEPEVTAEAHEAAAAAAGDGVSRAGAGAALAVALAAGGAGAWLVSAGSRGPVVTGTLLLVAALAAAAVGVAGRPWGPATEGPLDLSTRIALGALGGGLAGVAHGALQWLAGTAGLLDLPGIGVQPGVTLSQWGMRAVSGVALGLAFGLLLRRIPGRSHVERAAWFSLLPTLYMWLWHYPTVLGVGLLGIRVGILTPLVVALFNLAAGVVAGAVMAWGERTELAPLSRPLVE